MSGAHPSSASIGAMPSLGSPAFKQRPENVAKVTAQQTQIASRWPRHEADEIAAAAEVLASGRTNALVHGSKCRAFEAAFSRLCGMPHAIAVANGTLALELALRCLGIGAGDEVIVTPRSFFASAAVARAVGATPVFADVDPVSQNITAATIAAVITPHTRAVIPVHLAGWPCMMPEIMVLAKAWGLKVIEDCAQAHGATIDGRPVGSFGDAACFSFCTDKIISTGGEGGMLVVHDSEAWHRAWSYKDHGKSQAAMAEPANGQSFRYVHHSFGSNFRLTEMQAAIGLVQLKKLNDWVATRQRYARTLNARLSSVSALRITQPDADVCHAYYKYYVFLHLSRLKPGWNRDRIVTQAHQAGIPCFSGSCSEIYREQAFAETGLAPPVPLPCAHLLGQSSLMLPVDPTFSPSDIDRMGDILAGIVEAATN